MAPGVAAGAASTAVGRATRCGPSLRRSPSFSLPPPTPRCLRVTSWHPSSTAFVPDPSSPCQSHGRPLPAAQRRQQGRCNASLGELFESLRGKQQGSRAALKQELEAVVANTKFGARCTPAKREEIEEIVERLGDGPRPVAGSLEGLWELIYTTETAVHGITNVLPVERVTQNIDLTDPLVTNRIQLALGCAIEATAPATKVSPGYIAYAFNGGMLQMGPLNFGFDIRADGWTKCVFMDSSMRAMRNSQGDVLVLTRVDEAE